MSPGQALSEIVDEARKAKTAREYRRAAGLYDEAAQAPEAKGDPERRRALLRQAAACTYLDLEAEKANRLRAALALIENPEPVDALLELAKALKGEMAFGQARTLLAEARGLIKREWDPSLAGPELRARELKARQQHGLCTYKDVDLPPGDRFDEALKVLDGTDALAVKGIARLATTDDPETLGIAGAVHKAKWKYDTQRGHLERALHYYERGFRREGHDDRVGIDADDGYTAINTAYVLDLLAALEEQDFGPGEPSVASRRQRARQIRETILGTLPAVPDRPSRRAWWYAATLAEAKLGLGDFEQAADLLEQARNTYSVDDWEFESTARQLASVLDLRPGDGDGGARQAAESAFARGFGLDLRAAATLAVGKFGLALSGGGFRASLFHIGVLARLAELDVLRHVEVLSCVSGGSIVGAYYYLELRKLFGKKAPRDITRLDYINVVRRTMRGFLRGVQTNVRTRLLWNFRDNLRMIWRHLSRTERIARLFEEEIYSRIRDDGERVLSGLTITPMGLSAASGPFQPKYHNWRLEAKVPILILNASTLNTGHNWQFTASFMGESPLAIDPEIDGNERLRRLYYKQAPTEDLRQLRLARAVGASACVPLLFEPIALHGLYPGRAVKLVDGGVHDNQGLVGLLEQDCTVLLVSDASGHVGADREPSSSEMGVAGRSNDLLMARVRGAQYRDLKARLRSRVVRGLMFLHLRKDLDVNPVNWEGCRDPETPLPSSEATSYGIRKEVQDKVAAIRTDLDCFGEAEAFALMTSGYCMANEAFPDCIGKLMATDPKRARWRFLRIFGLISEEGWYREATKQEPWSFLRTYGRSTDPGAASPAARDDLKQVLGAGQYRFFRFIHLHPGLKRAATIVGWIAVLVAVLALTFVLVTFSSYPLLTAGTVAVMAIPMLLGLLGQGALARVLFPKQLATKLVRDIGIAIFGWMVAVGQLYVFDRWYLRRSRDYRKPAAPATSPPAGTAPPGGPAPQPAAVNAARSSG